MTGKCGVSPDVAPMWVSPRFPPKRCIATDARPAHAALAPSCRPPAGWARTRAPSGPSRPSRATPGGQRVFLDIRLHATGKDTQHGPQQDRPHRRRQYRRHARPPDRPEGTGRRRAVRRVRRRRGRQGARHHAVRPGGRLRRDDDRRLRLRRDQGRRRGDRHRRLPAHPRHVARRPDRQERRRDRRGRRRHPHQLPRCVRHLHHQPARRDGLGDEGEVRPARQPRGRHGRRARQLALPPVPGAGIRRLGGGRDRVRAGRPRRHDGAADPLLHGRRHPGARPGQDGLDHAGEDRRDRRSAPPTAAARSSSCWSAAARSMRRRRRRSPWPRAT